MSLSSLIQGIIPIPNQGAIFVGSSSAPQRTVVRLHRLNPRRLDFILDLKLGLHVAIRLNFNFGKIVRIEHYTHGFTITLSYNIILDRKVQVQFQIML